MAAERQHKSRDARAIDWSGAEFSDGVLAVELNASGAKGWSKDFHSVLALLEQTGRGWGKIALKGSSIRVSDVQPGSEEELRHFLESIVLQVNADLHLEGEPGSDQESNDQAQSDTAVRKATERRMAATFRGFADESS